MLVNAINDMIGQLAIFAAEVKKVAKEVGTEGNLGYRRRLGMCKISGRRLRESCSFLEVIVGIHILL